MWTTSIHGNCHPTGRPTSLDKNKSSDWMQVRHSWGFPSFHGKWTQENTLSQSEAFRTSWFNSDCPRMVQNNKHRNRSNYLLIEHILYCIVLYFIVLPCIVFYCIVWYHTVLYWKYVWISIISFMIFMDNFYSFVQQTGRQASGQTGRPMFWEAAHPKILMWSMRVDDPL